MHKPIAAACLALILISASSCVDHSQLPPEQRKFQPKRTAEDRAYQALAAEYLDGYFTWRPQTAVSLGFHEYDGRPADLLPPSLDAERTRLRRFRDRLAAIDQSRLSPDMSRESRVLRSAIDGELLTFEVYRSYWKNPMSYADSSELMTYAKRDFASKPHRLKSVIALLNAMPSKTAAARANLEEHLPRTFIKIAIDQAEGSAAFFNDDLVLAFEDVNDPALQSQFKQSRTLAANAMKQFAAWLRDKKLPAANDQHAIGRDAYVKMLRQTELMQESPEQILAIAMRELKAEQDRFASIAREIDPDQPAIDVYKSIQRDHPTEQTLIPETAKQLEQIRQFVIDRKLVRFPSNDRVKVEETPKFDRATGFAFMDAPGPFERAAQAFYFVTPTEPEWDAKRKEEWLSAFNYYVNDVTSIHEAYPGHFVQALHLKASPASKIDKTFGSYAFIEGWAHYTEKMVIDEGFPGNADATTTAKYRLAQSDEALLRLCRLCVSVQMHCRNMSVDDATRFFRDNAYYEEASARSEAERGTYD
ncbi:MAG: DUF885 domain-containing protein, partial [Anaerolineae bacterium]|nr:DUF885 domain-containing protein [Phycisphaerae bacterium]